LKFEISPVSTLTNKTAVLLLAHGTPDAPDDVPCFLHAVTGGRPLPQALIEEVKRRYAEIGRSPLRDFTMKQAEGVQRELGLRVYVGMRNWTPYIRDVVGQMTADGIAYAIVICLAPQNSRTSVGLYKRAIFESAKGQGAPDLPAASTPASQAPLAMDFVESWHDHPLLIRAFAEKLEQGWKRACAEAGVRLPIIFTAHSVPAGSIAQGDPYEEQARQTAELVAMSVGGLALDDWSFAFQSQGMSGGPWLGPTVEDTILALRDRGHRGLFMQPVGFLCDHVEVLYDIDIAFQKFAKENGMRLWRAESLNDSPLLVAALADVARSRMRPQLEPSTGGLVRIANQQ
jgi:ferrochelatase